MTQREAAILAIIEGRDEHVDFAQYNEGWRFQLSYKENGQTQHYRSRPHSTIEGAHRAARRMAAEAHRIEMLLLTHQSDRRHLPTTNMILPEPPEATGQN